mgnify:CR=1 FL=1
MVYFLRFDAGIEGAGCKNRASVEIIRLLPGAYLHQLFPIDEESQPKQDRRILKSVNKILFVISNHDSYYKRCRMRKLNNQAWCTRILWFVVN